MKNQYKLPKWVICFIRGGPNCLGVGRCYRGRPGEILLDAIDLTVQGPDRANLLKLGPWYIERRDIDKKFSFNTKAAALTTWAVFKL